MAKFMCVECGENEVDDEDDMCNKCAKNYEDNDMGGGKNE